jgi:hypothetical protein
MDKLDKFTAARIRLFQATGMAVQKPLPFDGPRFGAKRPMITADLDAHLRRPTGDAASHRQSA